ncbi:uncharacterized protein N7498_009018 [Penicillium cinerascens]|uniref:endo-1,3(4)-beta-glucanase n=1 Tax=Penicillium cinerascens TaxID=70096 RepID=A0A9W9MAR9_9EURO|nr:uncharacterized protein N7498_009018 [Penicillium cinerascens]KAJ5195580.1 hypothetical protein N7498_009018 [Penicillium cinerascens]
MVSSLFSRSAGSLFMLWLASPAAAVPDYKLVEKWEGRNFLDFFNFHVGSDPTNGFVNYLDQDSAEDAGLIKFTDSGSLYLGVDHKNKVASGARGRDSVRIGSKKYYEQSLIVADIAHMPGSACGTWPAFWSVGQNWPADGEIDIIEGVNLQDHNEIVMHTGGTCSIKDEGMSGFVNATGCGEDLGTVGCVIEGQKGSYGTSFNKQGGGVYAMEWTEQYLKIWFFPRDYIPPSITNGDPDVSKFGTPMALVEEGCDVANSFKAQSFIFDTTFCGDWAGGVFGKSGCPMSSSDPFQSCHNFVANNPSAFEQSYWEINSVKIYQTGVNGLETTSHSTVSQAPVAKTIATAAKEAPETTAIAETSEHSVAHETATRVVESSAVHTAESAANEETSPAGVVGLLGDSTTVAQASATRPPPGAFAATLEAPAPAATTNEKPSTTRYVTKYVTSFTTICEASSAAASVAEKTAKPATTEVTESAYSQVPAATQTSHGAQTSAIDVPNAGSSADAASKVANQSASTHALPTVIPGPGYNLGSASPLPSANSPGTSKPDIPAPTGSSAPSGSVFTGTPSAGYSPVFTGAADKVSVKFSTFAAVFAFALFA